MKKSDATPGTKVLASYAGAYDEYSDEQITEYRYDEDEYGDLVGVIRSKEASPGHVWVKWIEGEYVGHLDEDEMEVDLKLLVLQSDKASIEQEFKNVSKEIKEKMKEAGKLVKEANALAKKASLGPLANLYDASSPLVDAMDNAGWRSSSWGC
jgi:hypothetical protein